MKDFIANSPIRKSHDFEQTRPLSKRGRMIKYANALAKRPEKDHAENRPRSQLQVKRGASSSYGIEIKQK